MTIATEGPHRASSRDKRRESPQVLLPMFPPHALKTQRHDQGRRKHSDGEFVQAHRDALRVAGGGRGTCNCFVGRQRAFVVTLAGAQQT